jgi:hypothetical protein
MSGAQEPAEVSKIEQVEVEEAVRNATVIPEVAEPELIVEEPEEIKELSQAPVVDAPATELLGPADVETEAEKIETPGPETADAAAVPEEPLVKDDLADKAMEEPTAEVAKEESAKGVAEEAISILEESSAPAENASIPNEPTTLEQKAAGTTEADIDSLVVSTEKVAIDDEKEPGLPETVSDQTTAKAAAGEEIRVPE